MGTTLHRVMKPVIIKDYQQYRDAEHFPYIMLSITHYTPLKQTLQN